jgi:hypothetical protein
MGDISARKGARQATRSDQFKERIFYALSSADFDTGDLTDQLMQMIELAIRRRLKISGREFDLSFADLTRDILEVLDEKLAGAIDRDAAVDELCEQFLGTEPKPYDDFLHKRE